MHTLPPDRLSRRDAIRQTLVFSTGLLFSGWLSKLSAQTNFPKEGIHLLAFGDFGSQGDAGQTAVANQMAAFSKTLPVPPVAVLALGDNFYRELTPERFVTQFEEMYSLEHLNCPFYAVAGNHDYGTAMYDYQPGKLAMQLDYAKKNPGSRWKMPAKWYTREIPDADGRPLLRLIFLDSNFWPGALTPQEKVDQERFLEEELARSTETAWTWIVSHYPLFTEQGNRAGDNRYLIERWQQHLKNHNVSIYLSGHHHNLQHIEVEGYPCSFIVSGAGGARLNDITDTPRTFAMKCWGFNHFHVTRNMCTIQFINADGDCLHTFRRTLDGKATIDSIL